MTLGRGTSRNEPMFADEVEAVRSALTSVTNALFIPEPNDPRNLDPEDEPILAMVAAANGLLRAAGALHMAVRMEQKGREHRLDDMTEEEYDAWEASIA